MGPAELQPVPPAAFGLLVHSSTARLTSTHIAGAVCQNAIQTKNTQALVSLSLNILLHLKA